MRSDATTVEDYLAELDDDRRATIQAVRATIVEHLPAGYVETMEFGMIAYVVPLEVRPHTYNDRPLMYAALAAQRRHGSLYLMGIYADPEARARFEAAYRASGKRMDVGKSCVRFRTADDLPLDVVADAIGAFSVPEFLALVDRR